MKLGIRTLTLLNHIGFHLRTVSNVNANAVFCLFVSCMFANVKINSHDIFWKKFSSRKLTLFNLIPHRFSFTYFLSCFQFLFRIN